MPAIVQPATDAVPAASGPPAAIALVPDNALQRLAELSARLHSAAVVLISAVDPDSHTLRACHGLPPPEHEAALALCAEVLLADQPISVGDARRDPRLAHHALLRSLPLRACLARPLRVGPEEPAVGTLCVLLARERDWSSGELAAAEDIAATAATLLQACTDAGTLLAGPSAEALRLEASFRDAPAGLAHLSPEGAVWRANGALCRMLDQTPDELRRGFFWNHLREADRALLLDHVARLGASGSHTGLLRVAFAKREGTPLYADLSLAITRHPDGTPSFLTATVIDATRSRAVECELAATREDLRQALRARPAPARPDAGAAAAPAPNALRALADSLPAMLSQWDCDGVCLYANTAHRDYLAHSPEDLVGMTLAEAIGETLYQSVKAKIASVLAGTPQQFERTLTTRSGEQRVVNFIAVPQVIDGAVAGFFSLGVNITDLRESSAMLARREALLRATSEVAGVAGWEYDATTGRFHWSDVVFEILDMPIPPAERQTDVLRFFPPYVRDQIDGAFRGALDAHASFNLELPLISARRRAKWIRVVGEPQVVEGRCTGVVGAMQDVTTERASAQTLRAAMAAAKRASNIKDLFLANMSHEIRTPLNGVIGMTGLLLDTALSPEQREYVEIARSSGETLLALVSDILDLAKIESDQLELESIDFELRALTDEAVDAVALAAAQKNLDVEVDLQRGCEAWYRGDPTRLRQVLINLLGNAVKFTDKGAVSLKLAPAVLDGSRIGLEISITDTGVGIPPDKLDRLFTPFTQADSTTTRRFGGTGLGLSISRRIVEAMHGMITVESELGVGTTFRFRVELRRSTLGLAAGVPEPRSERALIVGAGDSTAATLIADLARLGIRAERCGSEAEGWLAWSAAAQEDRPHELVFVDTGSGDGEDCVLPARIAAHRLAARTRVLRLCTLGRFIARGTDPRFYRILQKPLRRHALKSALAEALSPADAAAQARAGAGALAGRRVLLAEDNPVNTKLERRLLERMGMVVTHAVNGRQALEALAAERFDVVLMDCQMPVLDGYEATRALRRGEASVLDPKVIVVALTAHALAHDRDQCFAAGMDDYVTKPIDPRRLESVLTRLLAQSASAGGEAGAGAAARAPDCDADGPAAPTGPAIDLGRLLGVVEGDGAFLVELLEAYLESAEGLVAGLRAALAADDDEERARNAHQLKGASLNVGAGILAALAGDLEQGRQPDADRRLAQAWERTAAAVRALIARPDDALGR